MPTLSPAVVRLERFAASLRAIAACQYANGDTDQGDAVLRAANELAALAASKRAAARRPVVPPQPHGRECPYAVLQTAASENHEL